MRMAMWRRWSLRAKIVGLTVGVVLPIMAVTTGLTVRLSRAALEDDIRSSGLTLARELAASAAASGAAEDAELRREVDSLFGKGSVVRDAVVSVLGPQGLVVRARGGIPRTPSPEEEIAARENQEVVVRKRMDGHRILLVAVPVRGRGQSIGAVSLGLPLDRVDALTRQAERQAVGLGGAVVVLIIGGLSVVMNRALARPLHRILEVMRRAEGGISRRRLRRSARTRWARWRVD
jgi:sensor histidine kinase regulating citrate/malate metabolism